MPYGLAIDGTNKCSYHEYMNVHIKPDTYTRLARLGDVTLYEPAGDTPVNESRRPPMMPECISHVTTPTGKKPVLKGMMTTACEKNCFYCPFRAGRSKIRRETFTPDEVARLFDDMQRARMVDGIFLSSGIIKGGATTQDKIIDTVEIIRRKYAYTGYVHLKIMPGADEDQILRAMQLADRVSINLEGPTPQRLAALAPRKEFDDELLARLRWAGALRQRTHHRLASLVTQFVVGAVGDTDLELMALSEKLYRQVGLARAYYSAFNPVSDTPFEDLQPVSPQREFRLYQSSFLLRDYSWNVEDLPFQQDGNLRLDMDPKRAWAEINLRHTPVDLMHADRDSLLRVPGIGPKTADSILKARRQTRLYDISQLRRLGLRAPEQAAPYILLDGRRPPQQLALFSNA